MSLLLKVLYLKRSSTDDNDTTVAQRRNENLSVNMTGWKRLGMTKLSKGKREVIMKKEICALNFSEKERICENEFMLNGPYWHVYTDGTKMQNIFCSEDDFNLGMWMLASVTCVVKSCRLITFELMSNHLHLIISGQKDECVRLFELLAAKLKRILTRKGIIVNWNRFCAEILPIETLQALRNEIIYVNRNAYVAHDAYTPDSYPWGGGCAFFNAWLKDLEPVPLSRMKINIQRELLHTREVEGFSGLMISGMRAFIPSFCEIGLGERMFRDPRSYFNALTRNAEAFSQIAARLKDSVFLTDDELFSATTSHISKEHGVSKVSLLNPEQRIETARHLHFNYNATNQQIRRILKLDLSVIEELFPK